jgi:CHAT domain-containing protein
VTETAWALGDVPTALSALSRGVDVREEQVARVITTGSERERQLFLATSSSETDMAISLHAQAAPRDPQALALALRAILRRKGRALDAMVDTYSTLHAHLTPEDAALLDELRSVESKMAQLAVSPPQATTPDEERKQLAALGDKRDALQAQLAAHDEAFRSASQPVQVADVARAIPADAVLLEIAAYRPFDPRGASDERKWSAPARYACYALRRDGRIAYADLGETQPIDDLVAELRVALADPTSNPTPASRALDERVGRPMRAIVGDARHVLIAPDGSLNLVPFSALVDERGELLVGHYAFTYLTTGRDLLRLSRGTATASAPVIVADPDFGPVPVGDADDGGAGRGADLRHVAFPPLTGTREEGRAIAGLFPGAIVLHGPDATKAALAALRAPRFLHVATHGFFLDDMGTSRPSSRGLSLYRGASPTPRQSNPLLRSGLVLAGANQHRNDDTGVMTALEASSLDLRGTQLVTLSACETGVGEVRNRDGVFGLRRALVLAGAQSEVMSLWKVDDTATRDLMISYYTALMAGGGRTEALREAQLALIASKAYAHPYFWASFIPEGDWRSLDGNEVAMPVAKALERGPPRVRAGCGCRAAGEDRTLPVGAAWAGVLAPLLAAAARRSARTSTRSPRGGSQGWSEGGLRRSRTRGASYRSIRT